MRHWQHGFFKISHLAMFKRTYKSYCLIFLCGFTNITFAQSFVIQRWQTTQGTQVIFHQTSEVPMLDMSIVFRAGSAYDQQSFGLSTLTTHLLNQGNAGLSADDIAEQLAQTGAQYATTNNQDMAIMSLRTLTDGPVLTAATKIFAKIIGQPDFPETAFQREKNNQLMLLRHDQASPNTLGENTFFQVLYQNHPYAHPINGQLETVKAIHLNEVRDFYHHYFVAQNATLVLVGAINLSTAKQIAEQVTQHLHFGQPAPAIALATPLSEAIDIIVPFSTSQTVAILGQLGITHQDPDYFPLQIGNYILGGNPMGSRLQQALREQRGLTYGVSSQFISMPGRGTFSIRFSTKNSQAPLALQVTRDTLQALLLKGPTEQELNAAKHYLTGSFPLTLASNRNLVELLIKMAFYHLPPDFLDTYISQINAVTINDVKQALQRHIKPDLLLQVTVGKQPKPVAPIEV